MLNVSIHALQGTIMLNPTHVVLNVAHVRRVNINHQHALQLRIRHAVVVARDVNWDITKQVPVHQRQILNAVCVVHAHLGNTLPQCVLHCQIIYARCVLFARQANIN